ncbi:MAG TPA: hypothetical protein VFU22_21475, partial [Roseiflexaceae bacterium]|nr:hypothetical protein [Roseiflexaceae bacterium]
MSKRKSFQEDDAWPEKVPMRFTGEPAQNRAWYCGLHPQLLLAGPRVILSQRRAIFAKSVHHLLIDKVSLGSNQLYSLGRFGG